MGNINLWGGENGVRAIYLAVTIEQEPQKVNCNVYILHTSCKSFAKKFSLQHLPNGELIASSSYYLIYEPKALENMSIF